MECSWYRVDRHQSKLTNVTAGVTQAMGSSEYNSPSGANSQTRTFGSTRVTITAATTYKIEHYCTSAYSPGLGNGARSGEPEVFTQVKITGTPS